MASRTERDEAPAPAASLTGSLAAFAADIKLSHSVFALPFAASAVVIGRLPLPTLRETALLVVCMVLARSFAMGVNRWLDHRIDAENPRTAMRQIPSGRLSPRAGLGWSLAAGGGFVAATAGLNDVALLCSVPLLGILASYSLLKRFTWLCHLYLGACLGLAPIAVSIALTGAAPLAVLALGLAITTWTAGFDCLYALQDMEFDRAKGLRSIPERFGPARTLLISRALFAAMVGLLGLAGWLADRGLFYAIGVAAVAVMLAYEQWIVRDARETGRSTRMNAAFFTANAWVSVLFFCFCVADAVVHGL